MIVRFLKTLVGILLIPVALGTAKAFYLGVATLGDFQHSLIMLERGVLAYLLFHVLIMRPVYIYVIGHEFVHVLATWVCGGHVESFNISRSGGSVITSKTNFFIELSPYFVPIYTLLLGPVFLVLKSTVGGGSDLLSIFLFLVGFTLAFHFAMTTEVLKMEQPDIAKSGIVLSAIVIFVFNLVLTIGVFCPFFGSISFTKFIKKASSCSAEIYTMIYDYIAGLF